MDISKLSELKALLLNRLVKLEHKEATEDLLLTESILEFILDLVNEKIERSDDSLIANLDDLRTLLND